MKCHFPRAMYGLLVSLVNESDAENIARWRSDPVLTKYMLTIDDDVPAQINWIREYKKRESQGLDLYLSFKRGEEVVGYARLSHIDEVAKRCVASSMIKAPEASRVSANMFLSWFAVAFEVLGLKSIQATVYKNNNDALKHWRRFTRNVLHQENGFLRFELAAEDYFKNKAGYEQMFGLSLG